MRSAVNSFNNLKQNRYNIHQLCQTFAHRVYAFRMILRINRYGYSAIDGLVFMTEAVGASSGVRTEIYSNGYINFVLRTVNIPYQYQFNKSVIQFYT